MDVLIGHILAHGRKKIYAKGELLFAAGTPADGLYYVASGAVRVYRMDEQGREVEIVRLGPGEFFGEAVVFASPVFPAFADATLDSEVLFLSKSGLWQDLDRVSGLARDLLGLLARKCLVLNRRIEVLELQTVRQRLVQFLLSRCPGQGSCNVRLEMKKGELAQLLGTIGETLSRNLKQLQEEGLIQVAGRRIHIPDCRRLQDELSRRD
jgi:CRP/FNR family transcriptional regulator